MTTDSAWIGDGKGGKQVSLTTHSTVPSIVIWMTVVFASWFRNGWCKLRNQHRGTSPHWHIAGEAGHTWVDKGWIALGEQTAKPSW